MTRLVLGAVFSLAVAVLATAGAGLAAAGMVSIACEAEDVMVQGWNGPLEVAYEGEASGTLTVKSAHVALSLPATREVRTGTLDGKPHSVTGITAGGATSAVMPDLAALDACAAQSVQPDFKDDADMYALAATSCLPKVAPGAAPVPIKASVSIALVPGEAGSPPDVTVEIKRTYASTSASPSGTASIEMFPRNCTLLTK